MRLHPLFQGGGAQSHCSLFQAFPTSGGGAAGAGGSVILHDQRSPSEMS